jgi:choline dehydrogenase-like flavoprotein
MPVDAHVHDGCAMRAAHEARFDAVIVGSGAGGAVLAKELAEGGMRVAVVEEGAWHREHRDLAGSAIGRLYRDGGATGTVGHPVIPVPLGRCFGGTTTINSGTCFRTPDAVLAAWQREHGLEAIETEGMQRALDRVEDELGVCEVPRGLMSRPNRLVNDLFEAAGLPGAPLRRNVRGCEGCGMCCYGCSSGAKQSMDRSYLPKALAAGAAAFTRARVEQILVERGRATGVVALALDGRGRPHGPRITLRADKVVLACGALLSPALLHQNRIARGNAHLGRHLTLHPATKVYAEFDAPLNPWEGVPQSYSSTVLKEDGIMFEGATMPPDLGAIATPFSGPALARFLRRYAHMASFGFMITDTAEGRLRRLPGGNYVFQYSLTETDLRRVRRAAGFLARLFLEGGAQAVHPPVPGPHSTLRTVAEVAAFEAAPLRGGDVELMAFHPLGSCRLGRSPEHGVCDPWHEVFGVAGLYVCDGSVVPTALGVNPQVTIMALATRLAERLLQRSLPHHASLHRASAAV